MPSTRGQSNKVTAKIGDLRDRVVIEEDQGALKNPAGEQTPQWVEVARRWANVAPLTAREIQQLGQPLGVVTHKVTLRYLPWLTGRHRFRVNGDVLHLAPPTNPSGLRFQTFMVVFAQKVEH